MIGTVSIIRRHREIDAFVLVQRNAAGNSYRGGTNCDGCEICVLRLLTRPSPPGYAAEVDVAISVPDIEVDVEPGRCTAQTYFNATYILIGIEFKVAHVCDFYAPDEIIVLLLLFAHGF
jgi:hypothetical protein